LLNADVQKKRLSSRPIREILPVPTAAARPSPQDDVEPVLGTSLERDAEAASKYIAEVDASLKSKAAGETDVTALKTRMFRFKERFFRRHAVAIYDRVTAQGSRFLRVSELLMAAAGQYPALLPTREVIDAERALKEQSAKEGRELHQGLFIGQVLADERSGMHLIHAMLREALDRLAEFRKTGFIDLGEATAQRKGNVGHVTLTNTKFLNAEDDRATAALEIAADLVLLDDAIQVCVLRGGPVQHHKYKDRRVFNSGINLTHLYCGQISFANFMVERELGLLHKIIRGHWLSESYDEQYEDYAEKPWIAAVEAHAIGGGCQLLCAMDRVIAEAGSYFNLPASKEGFIPGAANLRLPRLAGIKLSREGIFYERVFHAETPEGRLICDQVVQASEMDAAIERNARQLMAAGFTSAIWNRRALRVGEEPLTLFRRYYATYARGQSACMYDAKLIENLKHSWKPDSRRM
jgi:thioesterase DpgC